MGRGASGGELPCLAALPACFGCGGSCCSSALYGPPGEAWAPSGVVNTAYEEGEGGVAGDGRFFGVRCWEGWWEERWPARFVRAVVSLRCARGRGALLRVVCT